MPWDPEWDDEPSSDEPVFGALNRLYGAEFLGREPSSTSRGRDPLYAAQTTHETGVAYFDAWRIEDLVRSGQLQREGYRPGDEIRITWEDTNGRSRETVVRLPSDWRRHDAWSDFYERLREFYYPLWEEETGNEYDHEGGYVGAATAG